MSLLASQHVSLVSGGDIVLGPTTVGASSSTLSLSAGGAIKVRPTGFLGAVDVAAAGVSFASQTHVAVAINGATADSQYTQLTVQGDVNLAGAYLDLSGTLVPSVGQTFKILDNRGMHPIQGTFNGLGEGAIIPNFLGSALSAVISYVGGDGNDVVLTVKPSAAIPTIVTSSNGISSYGQSVTFTATVDAGSGTSSGSVEFFDDTTGADLGPGTLQTSGPSSATWTYVTGAKQLQATGPGADAISAKYVGAGGTPV